MERRRFLKYLCLAPVALKFSKFELKTDQELQMQQLSRDLAEFHNETTEKVSDALTKAMLGEVESLARFGINVRSICTKRILKETEKQFNRRTKCL